MTNLFKTLLGGEIMDVSYYKPRKIPIDKMIKKSALKYKAEINSNVFARLGREQNISLWRPLY